MSLPSLRLLLSAALFTSLPAAPPDWGVFLKDNCVKCHGPEKSKGKLRLDELPLPPANLEKWTEILEAVEYGDMPPEDEPRPDAHDSLAFREALTAAIRDSAHAPDLAIRRMNRTEFENSVRDLLHVQTNLAEFLPEDGSTQGFDKAGDGLSLSAVLLEKYWEAANMAFDDTIRRIPPSPVAVRRSVMMEDKNNISAVKGKKGGVITKDGAFIDFTPGWPPVRTDASDPIEPGIYRGRVAVWPHDPSERTLSVGIFVGPKFGAGEKRFIGVYDVTGTPENPRVIEFEAFMNEGESIEILAWIYPEHITYRDKHEPRPAIGVVWAETEGPLDQSFPSEAQKALFGNPESITLVPGDSYYLRHRRGVQTHHLESTNREEDLTRIITDFVPRALRRPVSEEVIREFVDLGLGRLAAGRSFEEAVRTGVCAVLCSPKFLLLNTDPLVDDYTIASRLSYFIWSSIPDDELLKLAAGKKLRDPEVRRQQVARMLADPKRERFIADFTDQWLDLRKLLDTSPDKKLYPEYDILLEKSLPLETRGFFRHLLENDLPVKNFADSDFIIINQRLANLYDIEGVTGHEEMRVVKVPENSIRGGVLTQASVLKTTANGTTTSPVLRGVWVLDHILGKPVPPPPPGVPAVEPDIRGATTPRELFLAHTEQETCARCHTRIDPIGFALEEFDPIGGHREKYRSLGEGEKVPVFKYLLALEIDSSGKTPDGQNFENFAGFKAWLAAHPEIVAHSLTEKLLVYGGGRTLPLTEKETVTTILKAAEPSDYGLQTLIQEVAASDYFLRP